MNQPKKSWEDRMNTGAKVLGGIIMATMIGATGAVLAHSHHLHQCRQDTSSSLRQCMKESTEGPLQWIYKKHNTCNTKNPTDDNTYITCMNQDNGSMAGAGERGKTGRF